MFETIAGTFAKNYAYNLIVKGKQLWPKNEDIGEKLG